MDSINLMTYIIIAKYADGMPFYRLTSRDWGYYQTLWRWYIPHHLSQLCDCAGKTRPTLN
jgi:hypothetical protein